MPQIFSLKTRDFLSFSNPMNSTFSELKKFFMIDKEMELIIARNFDNLESDIGKKILIIFKESLHSAGNFVNFHQKSIKAHRS